MAYGQPKPYNNPEELKEDIEFGKKACCIGIIGSIILILISNALR